MSSYGGIRKGSGEPWTDAEKEVTRALWQKFEKKRVQSMKAAGFDVQLIAIPLPDVQNMKKYKRDTAVKKFLGPYQTINPFRLKKPIVD